MMSKHTALALAVFAAAFAASSPAFAAPNDARAQEAFQQGLEHLKLGRAPQACPLFAEAHKLDPKVGYVVNLARCEAKLGQLVAANQHWKEALTVATASNDERRAEVERGVETSTRDLPHVVVTLPRAPSDPRSIKVVIDDHAIADGTAEKGTPVDLGAHHVVVLQHERPIYAADVRVTSPGERIVVLALLPELLAASSPPPPPPLALSDPHRGDSARTVGIGLGGAGLGLLALGAFAAVRANDKNATSQNECPNDVCTDSGFTLRNEAQASADLATIAVASGVVLAAIGVVVYLVAPRAQSTGPRAAAFSHITF